MWCFADKEYKIVLEKQPILQKKIYTIEIPDNHCRQRNWRRRQGYIIPVPKVQKSIKDAVEKAFSCAGDDENSVILAFGSLSFIGALTDAVEEYVG